MVEDEEIIDVWDCTPLVEEIEEETEVDAVEDETRIDVWYMEELRGEEEKEEAPEGAVKDLEEDKKYNNKEMYEEMELAENYEEEEEGKPVCDKSPWAGNPHKTRFKAKLNQKASFAVA